MFKQKEKIKNNNVLTIKSPINKKDINRKKYCDEVIQMENGYKPYKINIFPIIIVGIFFVFWFIICPLIWALLYHTVFSETWPHTWPYFYWTVALLIWLVLMIIFIIIWRYRKNSQNKSIDIKSSPLISKPQLINNVNSQEEEENENVKLFEVRNNDKESVINPRNLRENRPKLSPLIIIHQNISDNEDKEHSGDVEIVDEIDDDIPDTANPNRISQSVNRSSIKDYLKIVTVDSPSPEIQDDDDDDETSPPRPLSPRELFFIDLIRGAEKTTKNPNQQRPYRGSYFFGEDNKSSEIPKDNRRYTMGDNQFRKLLSTNAIKMKELKSASKENVSKSDSKISKVLEENEEQLNTLKNCDDNVAGGSEYFIADVVDSPSIKKAEIFLQIEPTVEDPDAVNQNE